MSEPAYVSTRGGDRADFRAAALRGLAPDGGLYVPERWPAAPGAEGRPYRDVLIDTAARFVGDALSSQALAAACDRAMAGFDHPEIAPLRHLGPNLHLLELFHGPTAAFKDFAMQLMAPLLTGVLGDGPDLLLLTATSGDTGAAAVHAFADLPRVKLVVFHPLDRVSPVQRLQMTTTRAANVLNLAVRGDFDDCQGLLKALLADAGLRRDRRVSSVNSVNFARLMGQVPYYLTTAARLPGARFVVPTGNFGDAFAGWIARAMGAPVGTITAAVNRNDALERAFATGLYDRRPAAPSHSVSMDVQAPSNFERLVFEATGRDGAATASVFETFARDSAVRLSPPLLEALRREVSVGSADESATVAEMARLHAETGIEVCPHTAVGLSVARRLPPSDAPTVVLATAHPAKFETAAQAALGRAPAPLERLTPREGAVERFDILDADGAAALARVQAFAASA